MWVSTWFPVSWPGCIWAAACWCRTDGDFEDSVCPARSGSDRVPAVSPELCARLESTSPAPNTKHRATCLNEPEVAESDCTWAERINNQTSCCRELYIPVYLPGSEGPQIAAQPAVYHWSSCGSRGAPEEVSSAWKPLCCYGRKPASEAAPGCTHSGCQSGPSREGTGCGPSKKGPPETQEHDLTRRKIITCANHLYLKYNYCIVTAFQKKFMSPSVALNKKHPLSVLQSVWTTPTRNKNSWMFFFSP